MQTEPVIKKITNIKWSQDEDDMLKTLISHYGQDFDRISDEINFTFQYQKMTMWQCKKRWTYSQNPELNRSQMSISEVNLLYRLYMNSIINCNDCYWDTIVPQFNMRTKTVLRQRFVKCLTDTIRKLALMYASEKMQLFYFYRIGSLCQLTLNVILYFSMYEAQEFELANIIFANIYKSCRIVHAWIHFHYLQKLLDRNDISLYLDRTILDQLPKFTEDDAANYIESIVLLDTLNRVCFNFQPYGLQDPSTGEHKDDSHTSLYPTCKKPKKKNRTKKNITLFKLEAIFTLLDRNQVHIIQNSDTAQLLLPIQSMLQKRSL